MTFVTVLGCVAALATAAAAGAQQETVEVNVGGEQISVVRDGNTVRLGSGVAVTVSGDWRNAGTRFDVDDSSILVDLGATEKDGQMRLNLAGDILFEFDKAGIRPDAALQLAKVAHVIRHHSTGQVEVIGHTDSVGADDYNQQLSEARALAVVRWLNAKEGIPADIMVAQGMGARQPVDYNSMPDGSDNPAGRAKNRRVEIDFTASDATRVQVGDTAIQVDGSSVNVGGTSVRVDESGVHIGSGGQGVTVQGTGVEHVASGSDGEQFACAAGRNCTHSCSQGDCSMACSSGAQCNFSCSGGDCKMSCASGAVCRFSCSGGDCSYLCASAAQCITSCSGEDCTCTGPGC